MSANQIAAWIVLALLILGASAVALPRRPFVIRLIYGSCSILCLLLATVALIRLLSPATGEVPLRLAVGLINASADRRRGDPRSRARYFDRAVRSKRAITSEVPGGSGLPPPLGRPA